MKLISLNTWGGKCFGPLIEFIKSRSQDTDIFCLQEVFSTDSQVLESAGYRTNLFQEISKVLPNYKGDFTSTLDNYLLGSFQDHFTDFNLASGQAIFIKRILQVITEDNFFVFGGKGTFKLGDYNSIPRSAQALSFLYQNHQYTVCNLHGIWTKEGKSDTFSRIKQSEKILEFLRGNVGKKIICGDFNLDINTESIKIIEDAGFRNLIKEFNIPKTRSNLYTRADEFADYTFVSEDIEVKSFAVPNLEISDHLPMILEFE